MRRDGVDDASLEQNPQSRVCVIEQTFQSVRDRNESATSRLILFSHQPGQPKLQLKQRKGTAIGTLTSNPNGEVGRASNFEVEADLFHRLGGHLIKTELDKHEDVVPGVHE